MTEGHWHKVTRQRHGARTWHHASDFNFAAGLRHAVLTTSEIARCALAFPVVFDEHSAPAALLRIDAPRSIFVSGKGAWRAAVLPDILRLYPFYAAPHSGAQGELTLWVEEAGGCVSCDTRDLSFFAQDGPAPEMADIAEVFAQRLRAAAKLSNCFKALEACGLLMPMNEGQNGIEEMSDYRCVDTARLSALSDAEVLVLHRARALGLAQACALSMAHVEWMQRAEALIKRAKPAPPETNRVADFLGEIGRAQAKDAELFTNTSNEVL